MIDQRFQLPRPSRKILQLIKEQIDQLTLSGHAVDASLQDILFVPTNDRFNRILHRAKRRSVIELNAQDLCRVDMTDQQQFFHELQLDRRLPNLTRTTDRNNWCDPGIELIQDLIKGKPAESLRW